MRKQPLDISSRATRSLHLLPELKAPTAHLVIRSIRFSSVAVVRSLPHASTSCQNAPRVSRDRRRRRRGRDGSPGSKDGASGYLMALLYLAGTVLSFRR